MNCSVATVNDSNNSSLLSQKVTLELNEKCNDDITNSNKGCKNKRQEQKLEN